jgi:phosphate transport system substrate-binding protein
MAAMNDMKRILVIAVLGLAAVSLSACHKGAPKKGKADAENVRANISGAGATFPAPLYSKWAEQYRASSRLVINYQSMGSGAGVKQIKAKTVDFGASDKPLKLDALDAAGLYQFPTVVGGVVPAYNLKGLNPGDMKLTGPLLADIFLGKIKMWNDPRIVALNPTLNIPKIPITVVHRSDGSGTTFMFVNYLAKVSPEWEKEVGVADAVAWPAGIGGKGNEGVSAFVQQTIGAIGYVEYAFALKTKTPYALVQNKAGHFPQATEKAFSAAAAGADWDHAPGNFMILTDQAHPDAWPISGATFILIHRDQDDANKARAVLNFFDWAYDNGDATANSMHFSTLPPEVKALVRKQWAQTIKVNGQPVYVPKSASSVSSASAVSASSASAN